MAVDFEKIWKEFRNKIYSFIRSRVPDNSTAEDITQDVFVRIYEKSASLQSEDKLQSWLYQIARNAIIDYYRTKKTSSEIPELDEIVDDTKNNVLTDLSECLRPMINKLPDHYKEAIILYEFEGKIHKEIALAQGISLSGSKTRVQRGREMLKKILTDCCRFEADREGRIYDFEKKSGDCSDC